MSDVTLQKDIGVSSGLRIINKKSLAEYPNDLIGASARVGTANDLIVIHLIGSPDTTAAVAILNSVELPTCEFSGLDITANVGTYIVNDITSVTADATNTKHILISIQIDNATKSIEVLAREKILGLYADIEAGKTFCCDLKEFSVVAQGTVLVLVKDFIK